MFSVLPLEIESLDNVPLAQFAEDACIELRDPSSVRVEAGKNGDPQSGTLFLLGLGLFLLFEHVLGHFVLLVHVIVQRSADKDG